MSDRINLFFDPTGDTTNAVKHRNILHIIFISLIFIGTGLMLIMIFGSLFRFKPFNRNKSSANNISNKSTMATDYDDYFLTNGIPFIVVKQSLAPTPETLCRFIRVGVQIYDSNDNPVTVVHWSRYRTFEGNSVSGSTVTVTNAIPYIFVLSGNQFNAKYQYQVAEASAHTYSISSLCENVPITGIDTVIVPPSPIPSPIPLPTPSGYNINTLPDPNRPIISFHFVV